MLIYLVPISGALSTEALVVGCNILPLPKHNTDKGEQWLLNPTERGSPLRDP